MPAVDHSARYAALATWRLAGDVLPELDAGLPAMNLQSPLFEDLDRDSSP